MKSMAKRSNVTKTRRDAATKDSEAKALLKELIAVKKLLILIASRSGATQPEIGKVLGGVSARQVRNILGKRK